MHGMFGILWWKRNKNLDNDIPPALGVSPNSFTYPDPLLKEMYERFVGPEKVMALG